jgi:hypothetical protein
MGLQPTEPVLEWQLSRLSAACTGTVLIIIVVTPAAPSAAMAITMNIAVFSHSYTKNLYIRTMHCFGFVENMHLYSVKAF